VEDGGPGEWYDDAGWLEIRLMFIILVLLKTALWVWDHTFGEVKNHNAFDNPK